MKPRWASDPAIIRCLFPLAKLCWPVFIYQGCLVIISWFAIFVFARFLTVSPVFYFDLKVFAGSLTVMRSGESIKTAGIWLGAEKHGPGNQPHFTDEANKIKKRSQMTWQRFALPTSSPDPNINFPTVWNSCVKRGEIAGGRGLAWRLLDVSVFGPKGPSCDESQGFYNLKRWQASSPSELVNQRLGGLIPLL